jgi:DNA-binding CsgD family transcriptional regulator
MSPAPTVYVPVECPGCTRRRLGLTDVDMRTLAQMAEGMSCPEAAEEDVVTSEAVKERRKNVARKLGARNGAHAVGLSLRMGLIDPDDPMGRDTRTPTISAWNT